MFQHQGIEVLKTTIPSTVGAIVGGILALFGAYLTHRLDASKREREMLRGKGEDLFAVADRWDKKLFGYFLRRGFVMTGKLTYNQALDQEIAEGKENSIEFGRIEMLIDVYFPTTRSAYNRLIEVRDRLNDVVVEHKRAYESGDHDGGRFYPQLSKGMDDLSEASDSFKLAIITAIRAV
jgi:hypothetical protein